MDLNKVYNIDCIEYMKTLPKEYVDLIIADPPYFKIYGEFDFKWNTVEAYIEWCKQWTLECERILKPNGSFYIWGVMGYNNGFPLVKTVDFLETNTDLKVVNWITQRNSRGRGTTRGYMKAREELVFMTKSKNHTWNNAYTNEKSNRKDLGANGKPRTNEFKRCSDVWIDITEASQSSKQRFKLSNGEADFLITCLKGEGLLKVGSDSAIIQIRPTAKEFEFVETNLNKLAQKNQ